MSYNRYRKSISKMKIINSKTAFIILVLMGSLILFQEPTITGNTTIIEQEYSNTCKETAKEAGQGAGRVCCKNDAQTTADKQCDAYCKTKNPTEICSGRAVCSEAGGKYPKICKLRCTKCTCYCWEETKKEAEKSQK